MSTTIYRRVGVFQSQEVYVLTDEQWFRDARRSTKPISDLINDWAAAQQVEVVFISEPNIQLIAKNDTERVYRTSVSVLYVPSELIQDGKEKGGPVRQSKEIRLPETPQEVFSLLGADASEQSLSQVTSALGSSAARRASAGSNVRKLPTIPRGN